MAAGVGSSHMYIGSLAHFKGSDVNVLARPVN